MLKNLLINVFVEHSEHKVIFDIIIVRSHESHVMSHESHVRSHESHVRSHESHVRSHESHVRSHESHERSHESHVRSHTMKHVLQPTFCLNFSRTLASVCLATTFSR